MPLVFAAITPHPPLLIPTIGKNAIKKVQKTKEAMEKLEEELYLTKPDALIIISPHGSYFSDVFTMNICSEFETDLSEFGDITTKLKFRGDMELSALIREAGKDRNYATAAISERKIDHGCAVPLYYLTRHLPNVSLLPLGFSDLDFKTHLDFGELLKEQINSVDKRVAVIASGDLSHALETDAPAGYNAAGPEFDKKIQELLAAGNVAGMLQMDTKFISDAAECGFRSFLVLMGVLRGMHYTYKAYAYEHPFGVGYLTADFAF